MAIQYRGYKYSFQFFKNSVGSSNQIPAASVLVLPQKQGARISGAITGSAGAQTIPVYDPGSIATGDTIYIDANNAVNATVGTVTSTTITTVAGGLLVTGGRVVVASPLPAAFTDDQCSVSAGVILTNAAGGAEFYLRTPVADCFISGTGITTQILADQYGDTPDNTPQSFGIVADGSTNDTAALQAAVTRAVKRGKEVLELPAGTIRINDVIAIVGASGLRIVGKGRGITKILQANDSAVFFTIDGTCVDVSFEDMDLAGSGSARTAITVIETTNTVAGTAFRRLRLIDGGGGLYLQGTDGVVDDIICSGTRWTTALTITAGQRTQITKFRARFGAAITAGIAITGASSGVSIENADISFSSGAGVALSINSASSKDCRVSNSRFSGGTTSACVLVTAGNTNIFTNVVATGGLYGFCLTGGTNTIMNGCVASLNQQYGYYITGAASFTSMTGCKSSDANQDSSGVSHCYITGAVNDVSIWDFQVGRFTGGVLQAGGGVQLADGVGTRIHIGKVFGEALGISGGYFIFNQKTYDRVGIYITGHGSSNDTGAVTTPEHLGFAMVYREVFTGATINVDGVNYITALYGAPTNITGFTGGAIGQIVYVTNQTGGSTLTFVDSATLQTATGGNWGLVADATTAFIKTAGTSLAWMQMGVNAFPLIM
jgi:hypothetical protein